MTDPNIGGDPVAKPRLSRSPAANLLIVVFVFSRIAWAMAGVRFDDRMVDQGMQVADPVLLHHDLFRSLWYLHIQPPLYNLLLGGALNLFGSHFAGALQVVYLAAGLALMLGSHRLLVLFGVGQGTSFVVAAAIGVCPSTILYENWLFYTYLEAALLVLAALAVHRYLELGRRGDTAALAALLAALPLLRSLYHLVWLLAVLIFMALVSRYGLKRILALGAVPVILVSSVYVKNLVMFHDFTASTFQGPNFSRVTTYQLSARERERLVNNGTLSRLAEAPSFISSYPVLEGLGARPPKDPRTSAPVLDRATKTGSTGPNFNYRGYLPVFAQQLRDAIAAEKAHPDVWLRSQGTAWVISSYPSTDNIRLYPNRGKIEGAVTVESRFLGQFTDAPTEFDPARGSIAAGGTAWLLVLAFAVSLLGLPWLALATWRGISPEQRYLPAVRARIGTLMFCWFAILSVTMIGNAFELGENNRFRFAIDPLLAISAVVVAAAVMRMVGRSRRVRTLRRKLRHRRDSQPSTADRLAKSRRRLRHRQRARRRQRG